MTEPYNNYTYALFIRRYGRYQNFHTISALREELKRYFTSREIAGGIINRLTEFDIHKPDEYGCTEISYQDFECLRYLKN